MKETFNSNNNPRLASLMREIVRRVDKSIDTEIEKERRARQIFGNTKIKTEETTDFK